MNESSMPASLTLVTASESGPETILVVDDQPDTCELISTILRNSGYRVLTANGSERAVQIARGMPRIDLLITDIEMPGVTGDELAQWFRISRPDVQIVFMSGNPAHRRRFEGTPFLDKPFRPLELLLETVRDVLIRGRTNRSATTVPA